MNKKVFIIDDHPIVRRGLLQLINEEKDLIVIGEASDASEAMEGISKKKPDLVLMDISLKGISGIELTKNILAQYPKIYVLVISMYDESIYLQRALLAGAKGYLTKQEATKYLIIAIKKILNGEIYIADKWKDKLIHKFIKSDKESPLESLTDRELEVVKLLGQEGYSTQKIAEKLHVSVKTVESHYSNIKSKLNLKDFHDLIQYAAKLTLTEK